MNAFELYSEDKDTQDKVGKMARYYALRAVLSCCKVFVIIAQVYMNGDVKVEICTDYAIFEKTWGSNIPTFVAEVFLHGSKNMAPYYYTVVTKFEYHDFLLQSIKAYNYLLLHRLVLEMPSSWCNATRPTVRQLQYLCWKYLSLTKTLDTRRLDNDVWTGDDRQKIVYC